VCVCVRWGSLKRGLKKQQQLQKQSVDDNVDDDDEVMCTYGRRGGKSKLCAPFQAE
jgi:hypothetical protein